MAKGGKQPGAGRPKGSITRPQLRDYFTELWEMIRTHMVDDMQLLRWTGEQLFGNRAALQEPFAIGEAVHT